MAGKRGGGLVFGGSGREGLGGCVCMYGRAHGKSEEVCKRLSEDLRTWWWSVKGNAGSEEGSCCGGGVESPCGFRALEINIASMFCYCHIWQRRSRQDR